MRAGTSSWKRWLVVASSLLFAAAATVDLGLHAGSVDGRHHRAECRHAAAASAPTAVTLEASEPLFDDSCPPCLFQSASVRPSTAALTAGWAHRAGAITPPAAPEQRLRVTLRLRGPPAA